MIVLVQSGVYLLLARILFLFFSSFCLFFCFLVAKIHAQMSFLVRTWVFQNTHVHRFRGQKILLDYIPWYDRDVVQQIYNLYHTKKDYLVQKERAGRTTIASTQYSTFKNFDKWQSTFIGKRRGPFPHHSQSVKRLKTSSMLTSYVWDMKMRMGEVIRYICKLRQRQGKGESRPKRVIKDGKLI